MEITKIIAQIHAYNRCWKNAKQQWGDSNPITILMRKQKTDLQLHLLLHHEKDIICKIDAEQSGEEAILALTLKQHVSLNSINYYDAAHLPLRLTSQLTHLHSKLKGN